MKVTDLPKKISVFPLSNFIIFPKTTVPLNIFEPRYIDMINDSMKSNKIIGMIQPISSSYQTKKPQLHKVGCIGKITSFRETEDGRFLIELKGISRFKSIKELDTDNKYRVFEVDYQDYLNDLNNEKEDLTSLFDKLLQINLNLGFALCNNDNKDFKLKYYSKYLFGVIDENKISNSYLTIINYKNFVNNVVILNYLISEKRYK